MCQLSLLLKLLSHDAEHCLYQRPKQIQDTRSSFLAFEETRREHGWEVLTLLGKSTFEHLQFSVNCANYTCFNTQDIVSVFIHFALHFHQLNKNSLSALSPPTGIKHSNLSWQYNVHYSLMYLMILTVLKPSQEQASSTMDQVRCGHKVEPSLKRSKCLSAIFSLQAAS